MRTQTIESIGLLAFVAALVAFLGGFIVRDYNARMTTYNASVCATYGQQPDCVTPLVQSRN